MLNTLAKDRFATLKRGDTKILTIASGAQISDEAVWETEYSFFKIAPVSFTGLPAAAVINLMTFDGTNNRVIFDEDNQQVSMTRGTAPADMFVWAARLHIGINRIKLRLSAVTTAEVKFQVTPYAPVE